MKTFSVTGNWTIPLSSITLYNDEVNEIMFSNTISNNYSFICLDYIIHFQNNIFCGQHFSSSTLTFASTLEYTCKWKKLQFTKDTSTLFSLITEGCTYQKRKHFLDFTLLPTLKYVLYISSPFFKSYCHKSKGSRNSFHRWHCFDVNMFWKSYVIIAKSITYCK